MESPLASYYLLVGATVLLVLLGLVMVLSASSINSLRATDGHSPYLVFANQLRFAALGVAGALVASRLPVRVWKALALPLMVLTIVMQGLVFTRLGVTVQGNRNWIAVAGQRLQPSEFAKVALVLFGALVLGKKRTLLGRPSHVVVPLMVPAGALLLGLVLAGHDLGTGLVLFAIIAGLLFAAGVPGRMFLLTGAVSAGVAGSLVLVNKNRMGRMASWLQGCTDPNACFQSIHGKYALADGGWWGLGLGASREKWQWLPEAHNDFIFSVIGEELGLPGTLAVLGLFAALAFACYRLVLHTDDFFVRIATAGVMVWVIGQAVINIGAVIGLLPVIGVPLPLVSSGGSALLTTLFALGMLVSFARREPACAAALAARPGVVSRSLAVVSGARRPPA